MRFLVGCCVGIAATLAWQSYGDPARAIIASSYPELGWLAPQSAIAQTVASATVPAGASLDPKQMKAISLDLTAVRQKVDQLTAGQEKMARDFTKLQAAEQGILDKISAPPPRPAGATPGRDRCRARCRARPSHHAASFH